MGKSLNKIALIMWVIAILIIVGETISFIEVPRDIRDQSPFRFIGLFWPLLRPDIISSAALVTFGTIIELLDQIRWNALPPDQRNRR